ncbi:MAG: FKBP-type peptidyl-prolyl cis-trans isomerase [Eubacterium sp.]|nr:FKBP-type peptidyl-prolyl cis-trans isomerase [Eubacterium sp.]
MKIAVTYDNGTVFQHFGKTKEFKLYEVEDGAVRSSQVVSCGETGHEALAGLLKEQGVSAVICGGLGGGMQTALADAGIEVCSGQEGDADAAVEAFLKGELVSDGVNCDHHDHEHGHAEEEKGCGCGNEESCGSGCGGGCAGCGHHEVQIIMEGKNAGKICRVHYKGTFNDGTEFDSSYKRNEPLEFICGAGMMIRGFDEAVLNMEEGDEVDIHLMPEEAYGEHNPDAVFTAEISKLAGSEDLHVGDRVYLQNGQGQPFPVTVTEKTETEITLDANHEMAGKELNFHIELLSAVDR